MTPAGGVAVVIAGAVASVIVSIIGYIGSQKAKTADLSVAVSAEMREWMDDIRESEHDCREELAALRSELGQLRQKLAAALRKLDDQQREIDRLERMMASHVQGKPVPVPPGTPSPQPPPTTSDLWERPMQIIHCPDAPASYGVVARAMAPGEPDHIVLMGLGPTARRSHDHDSPHDRRHSACCLVPRCSDLWASRSALRGDLTGMRSACAIMFHSPVPSSVLL